MILFVGILCGDAFSKIAQIEPALGLFFQLRFQRGFFGHQLLQADIVAGVQADGSITLGNALFKIRDILIDGFVLALFLEGKLQLLRTVGAFFTGVSVFLGNRRFFVHFTQEQQVGVAAMVRRTSPSPRTSRIEVAILSRK